VQPPARKHSAFRVGPKSDLVLVWNQAVLDSIRAESTPPPLAARNLAIVHAAMYDAVNAVERTHRAYVVAISAPPGASVQAAAAVAAHRSLIDLYPKRISELDALLDESLGQIPEGAAKTDGYNLGRSVAEKILDWRSRDMQAARISHEPNPLLGHWWPTFPGFKSPLLPGWATVKPFAIKSASAFRPDGPPALTSEKFANSFQEVKMLGGVHSEVRTRDQTEIARFWADDAGTITPPGHWNMIAQTAALQRQTSMSENARLFAMLNVALADAAIACWDSKFHYDFWRPITAIRNADKVDRSMLRAERDWAPLLNTPPFPAYTSGHSTFSGAAAASLAHFFGTDSLKFTAVSDGLPGVSRSFSSFSAAAREAGMSRIYGGIHWDFDNREGLACGKKIGDFVSESFFQANRSTSARISPTKWGIRIDEQ